MSERTQREAEPKSKDRSKPDEKEKLVSEIIVPGEKPTLPATALAVNMSAFDGSNTLVIDVKAKLGPDKQEPNKPEQAKPTTTPALSNEQRRELVKELDDLRARDAGGPRQFEILTKLGKACAQSSTVNPADQSMARYYMDEAIKVGTNQGIAPDKMRDLYKESAEFLMQHKTKYNDRREPVPDKDAVMDYLSKAIDASEKVFQEKGSRNAEDHARLIEYKAQLHQSFGTFRDHEDAIMLHLRARDVRDLHKVPESHESAMAMKSSADSYDTRRGLDPLSVYLKAFKIAAALPGEDLMPFVDKYLDTLKQSPANHYKGDHKKLVDSLKEVVQVAEDAYGAKSEKMLPILEKVASLSITDPQVPSAIKAKYAIEVLEKMYALQKKPEERISTLASIGHEMYRSNNKDAAMATWNKMLSEAETAYGKDDPRMVTPLSHMAFAQYATSDYAQSVKTLERIYQLQTANNASPEDRINTLISLSHRSAYGREGREKSAKWFEQAVALGEKSYPKDDPRYEAFLRTMAGQFRYSYLHEQTASVMEKLYDIQTAQNADIKERLKTVQEISQHHFDANDYEKGAKAYARIVEMIKDKRELASFLQLPSFLRSDIHLVENTVPKEKAGLADETKKTNALYELGNTLREAGSVLDGWGQHNSAFENYKAALECFDQCLTRGTTDKSAMADMLTIADVELKHEPMPEDENEDQRADRDQRMQGRQQYEWDLERLHRDAITLISADKSSKDPQMLGVLDKISLFLSKRQDHTEAAPVLEWALSLAKEQKKPLEEIGQRAISLSYAQSRTVKPAKAVETCKDLLKYAQEASGDKPNPTSLLALKQLAYHSEHTLNPGNLEQALAFKEQQLDMATALKLKDEARAEITEEKGKLQLKMGDKKNAFVTMQEALKLNENILESPEFVRHITELCRENQHPDQIEGLLRRTVAVRKVHDPYMSQADSAVELAQLLKDKNDPAKLKEAAQIVEEARDLLLPRIEAAKNNIDNRQLTERLQYELSNTLGWLAPYYEEQKNIVAAEKAYLGWSESIKSSTKFSSSYSRNELKKALTGLVRIYKTQGKRDEAEQAEEELNELNPNP